MLHTVKCRQRCLSAYDVNNSHDLRVLSSFSWWIHTNTHITYLHWWAKLLLSFLWSGCLTSNHFFSLDLPVPSHMKAFLQSVRSVWTICWESTTGRLVPWWLWHYWLGQKKSIWSAKLLLKQLPVSDSPLDEPTVITITSRVTMYWYSRFTTNHGTFLNQIQTPQTLSTTSIYGICWLSFLPSIGW